jgi:LAS superfamily LD-carboxypeptidase LdcB
VDAQGDGRNGWGGFKNGRIPLNLLAPVPWAPQHLLRQDATAALTALNAAWRARFGSDIVVNDAYRDFAGQEAARAGWCARGNCKKAAVPGESNHGWALAIDIQVSFSDAKYRWLKQNAPSYGWVHPAWAEPDGSNPESWHWEFAGT